MSEHPATAIDVSDMPAAIAHLRRMAAAVRVDRRGQVTQAVQDQLFLWELSDQLERKYEAMRPRTVREAPGLWRSLMAAWLPSMMKGAK